MQTFLVLLLLSISVICNSNIVDYYAKLIRTEEKRAKTFTLPKDSKDAEPFDDYTFDYGIFDHIVVGAGSAGAIVASRLSEDPFRNVLLLEAGRPETDFTDVPGMAGTAINLEYNWNYLTIPQTTCCLGMDEKRCRYPRGKMISGSSGINGLVYTRGNKHDFDNWCKQGNPGWCYKDVLPFFIKSENSEINGDVGYHGFGGYLNVEYTEPTSERQLAFIEANKELNRSVVDYNGKQQEGVGIVQVTQKHGRRGSSGRMFLDPVSNRANLKIESHSQVVRVLINRKSKTAFGVLFAQNNKYYVVKSRKDIIISAGAIGSPQLLMLSGIGPKVHLRGLGIRVTQNLPVGQNFQDHIAYSMLHFITNSSQSYKSLQDNIKDYLNGVGELTNVYDAKSMVFLQTKPSVEDFPDMELIQMGSRSTFDNYNTQFNFNNETYMHGFTNFDPSTSFMVNLFLLHPRSKGEIKLKSTNPFEYPIIDAKLLSDLENYDIQTLYNGIQHALRLLETKALKKLAASLHHVHLPACKNYRYMSKRYWYCQIRQGSTASAHPVGTCKMGPDSLQGAVVDHKLRVHGIKNLRVADASIMPDIPAAHTNAPAMMIGEKAAHMIRFE